MRHNDKRERDLQRLQQQRQAMHVRMDRQRDRLNKRFDRLESRLSDGMGDKQTLIIATALRLLDEEGIDSLSLRKLGSLLNMQAPALYWHFKNKTLLVDYMAEAILKEAFSDM
ncbi:MAG TPA: TetR family transcriptional regulator, partial [Verrucomicrobiae bacterium]|nr:TetR family transcriptional regulator [Verrucomicrobiae bacterium]